MHKTSRVADYLLAYSFVRSFVPPLTRSRDMWRLHVWHTWLCVGWLVGWLVEFRVWISSFSALKLLGLPWIRSVLRHQLSERLTLSKSSMTKRLSFTHCVVLCFRPIVCTVDLSAIAAGPLIESHFRLILCNENFILISNFDSFVYWTSCVTSIYAHLFSFFLWLLLTQVGLLWNRWI